MSKYVMKLEVPQAPEWEEQEMAEAMGQDLLSFLAPLLMRLEAALDKRLVRTFAQTILAIVCNRDRARCLVQMELGALSTSGGQGKSRRQTPAQPAENPALEKRVDRRMAAGRSRASGAAVGNAGGDPDCGLGRQCAGEARESAGRGAVSGAFEQSRSAHPPAPGLLPSAGRPHLCARSALAWGRLHQLHSHPRACGVGGDAVLDDARGPAQRASR